ncbi:hypothetical protein KP509_05G092500 [Ceratopteris richardii]|uniref:Uncharacterized protein n=1 Tax=Ceratopteris richardii TaxID=49495 RepID=A0A8T2UVE8_CERRI|nr:hypothetical protein KP509_05G092500 [Ceratopteris richardii]
MGYIGKHGIEALKNYKYSGLDCSYPAKYVLQLFWSCFVQFFPLWILPNMIMLMGFAFVIISALLGYIYSLGFDLPSPNWIYLMQELIMYMFFVSHEGPRARAMSLD